jgi:hypothetical protein
MKKMFMLRAALRLIFASGFGASLASNFAFALPQYQRLLRQEYGFKAPCATCHTQGGGSSLTAYGKAFERAGKSKFAITKIASIVPSGDKLDFGTKLKARANPNDPASTPQNPGDWAGKSDVPTAELKEFAPTEIEKFSLLEGELKPAQIETLKVKLGSLYQDEDKYPSFYFGEVGGKKTYVVQYVRLPTAKKTLGLVVSTKGEVTALSFVGANKGPVSPVAKEKLVGKKLSDVEKAATTLSGEDKEVAEGVQRGLTGITLAFGGGK